jgi:hypothetical protein
MYNILHKWKTEHKKITPANVKGQQDENKSGKIKEFYAH